MIAIVRRIGISILVIAGVLYLCDYLSVAIPIPKSRQALGSFVIQPTYAIGLKNKKVEYDYDVPPETVVCVESWLPHLGYSPCWYVARHLRPIIEE